MVAYFFCHIFASYKLKNNMRLTVHVSDAIRIKEEVKTKDGAKLVTKTMNTLSYPDVKESQLNEILGQIENDKIGTVTSYHFSGEKMPGRAFCGVKKVAKSKK